MISASPVWHPFTQHALEPAIPEIVLTEGAYLHKANGARILDAISSWWVVTHGHRHPGIMRAIETTASSLDQIIFAGFTPSRPNAWPGCLSASLPPDSTGCSIPTAVRPPSKSR